MDVLSLAVPITLNGQPWTLSAPSSVSDLLGSLDLDEDAVAVEHNRRVVTRSLWASTRIEAGDIVEIVRFVGGG